jgi:hypothetical protein
VLNGGTAGVGVQIAPKLLTDIPISTVIKTGGNITMSCRLDTDVQLGITYVDGILSNPGTVKLIEAL